MAEENKETTVNGGTSDFINLLGLMKELRDSDGFDAESNQSIIDFIEKGEFILDKIQNTGEDLGDEDLSDIQGEMSDIDALLKSGNLEPKGEIRENLSNLTSQISEGILSIGSVINAFKDSKTARNQIEEAKSNLNALKTPEGVQPLKRSVNLKNAMRLAKSDLSPVSQEMAVQGLKQDVLDQYDKDVNSARTASAGQAGAFGSLSQAASNRRLRNALKVQEQKRNLRRDSLATQGSLINSEIAENTAAANTDSSRAFLDDRVFSRSAQAAGQALADGRMNTRTARGEKINAFSRLSPYLAKGLTSARGLLNKNKSNKGNDSKLMSFNTESDIVDFGNSLDNSLSNYYI